MSVVVELMGDLVKGCALIASGVAGFSNMFRNAERKLLAEMLPTLSGLKGRIGGWLVLGGVGVGFFASLV